jgi:hypothetical protein
VTPCSACTQGCAGERDDCPLKELWAQYQKRFGGGIAAIRGAAPPEPERAVVVCTRQGGCSLGRACKQAGKCVSEATLNPAPGLPDTNPKTAFGVQKAPLHLIPPAALLAVAGVMGLGAKKYGAYNWRQHAVSASVYQAAAMRHLLAWWGGEEVDPESGESHLAHAIACCAIVLDAAAVAKLNDDRPKGEKA